MSDRIPSGKWGVVQVLLSAVAAKGKVFGKTKLAAVLPVDIPTGWEPRTKQQPTGLIAYPAAQGRAVQVLLSAQKKKRHTNVCLFLVRVVIQHFLKTIVVQFVFEVIG